MSTAGGTVQAAGLDGTDKGSNLVSAYDRAFNPALTAVQQASNSPAGRVNYGPCSDPQVRFQATMRLMEAQAVNRSRLERGLPPIESTYIASGFEAFMDSYVLYSNPFLGVQSSQTHPDDAGLHYGMQVANVVSLVDLPVTLGNFGRFVWNGYRALRGAEAAKDGLEAAQAARGAEAAGQAADAIASGGNSRDLLLPRPTHPNAHGFSIRDVNPSGNKLNCAECSVIVDDILANGGKAGRTAAPAAETMNYNLLERIYKARFSELKTLSEVTAEMQAAGPGARGILFGIEEGAAEGHFFNVANQGGQLRFLCGQAGGAIDPAIFVRLRLLRTNP